MSSARGVGVEVRVGAVLLDAAAAFDALGDVAGSARHAERAGLDSLWAGDHLLLGDTPLLDSTLTLAAAAAVTRTIAIGTGGLPCPPYGRSPGPADRSPPSPTSRPADWNWASGPAPAPARSRSTARRVSCAVTAGDGRTSSSRPFPSWWPVGR